MIISCLICFITLLCIPFKCCRLEFIQLGLPVAGEFILIMEES